MSAFKFFLEKHLYGVCHYLSIKMGLKTERVRLYFIYLTFGTVGSSILLYLILAFWLNIKKYLNEGKRSVFDL